MKMILGDKGYGEYGNGKCFFIDYYKRNILLGNSKTNVISYERMGLRSTAVCRCELPAWMVTGDRIILHAHKTRAGNIIVDKIEKCPSDEKL